jgi:hypothetical protein
MIFAARKKSIDEGFNQLDFFKNIFQEGMIIGKNLFDSLIIPWLEDFKIITEDNQYNVLLNHYIYKIIIPSAPLYGEFALSIQNKIYAIIPKNMKFSRYNYFDNFMISN